MVHGTDHGLHGGENVLVDELGVAALVLVSVTRAMNDAHLFDEGALATLTRAWRDTHGIKYAINKTEYRNSTITMTKIEENVQWAIFIYSAHCAKPLVVSGIQGRNFFTVTVFTVVVAKGQHKH